MNDTPKPLRKLHELATDHKIDTATLQRSCIGRLVSMVTFLVVITCLGLWIAAFFLLKGSNAVNSIPGDILTKVLCVVFFGGLITAVVLGSLVGNSLRRTFWRILLHRNQRIEKP